MIDRETITQQLPEVDPSSRVSLAQNVHRVVDARKQVSHALEDLQGGVDQVKPGVCLCLNDGVPLQAMGKLTMNTGIGSWVLPVESIFQQDGVKALEKDASQGRGGGGQVHLGQIAHRSIGRYVRLPSPLGLLS